MTTENKYWYLKHHRLFDELSRMNLNELCYLGHFKTHRKGEIVDLAEQISEQNPSLSLRYTKLVDLHFRRLENRYENLLYKDVRTRWTFTWEPGQRRVATRSAIR